MPKIKNQETTRLARRAAELLEAKGIEPLDMICELLTMTVPLPRDKAAKRSALSTNYEYAPDGKSMRPNVRLRAEWILHLASLKYPKIKAVEVTEAAPAPVFNVVIRSFSEDGSKYHDEPVNQPAHGEGWRPVEEIATE
jgi:hypothetical protein